MNETIISLTLVSCLALSGCAVARPTSTSNAQSATRIELRTANSNSSERARSLQPNQEKGRQTVFGAEDEIQRPVSLPKEVLHILIRDQRVQRADCGGKLQSEPFSWFGASEINLGNDKSVDLIVQPVGSCLLGANLAPFWVFIRRAGVYRLVLRVDALRVEILEGRTKGYRNIRTSQATAREVMNSNYVFNGKKYEESGSVREPIQH